MTKTMKLSVQLDADTVTTLVDSGSTHSFISTEAACRLHLEPAFRLDLQVTVTNGDKAPVPVSATTSKFLIDAEVFVLDFFIIPLAGYEMVLDVQWL
jgi:hypothetical protein